MGEFSSNRRLKFSIENILSPEFGKDGNKKCEDKKSHRIPNHFKCQLSQDLLDFSAFANKRKHSSDSESSSISSLSVNSKEHLNGKLKHCDTGKTKTSNGLNSSSPGLATTPPLNKHEQPPKGEKKPMLWPAWVYCTRYSDRPSSVIKAAAAAAAGAIDTSFLNSGGPRSRKMKKKEKKPDEKRPRTAFTAEQLARLKQEFQENRYLTEKRRQDLARDLKLNESQIKIWFQNKRAKIKKSTGSRNPLALHLMAQGLYNHSTVPVDEDDDDDFEDRTSSCTSPPDHADDKSNL